MKGHSDAIYDFCLDREKGVIYSAGSDGYLVKWSIDEPEIGELVLQTDEAFYSIYLDEQDQLLYAGTRTGKVYEVNLTHAKLERIMQRHEGGVFLLSKLESDLISGGEDGVLKIGEDRETKLSPKSLRCIAQSDNPFSYWEQRPRYLYFRQIFTISDHT